MQEIDVAVRFLHMVATLLALGTFTFIFLIGRPAVKKTLDLARVNFWEFERAQWRILAWCLTLTLITGIAAFILQTSAMTGLSLARALTPETFGAVLMTQYGKVWLLRQAMLAGLAGVVLLSMRGNLAAALGDKAGFTLGVCLSACLALTGHAAAGEGTALIPLLGSSALHLVATGMWLGALPGLAMLLEYCRSANTAQAATVAKEATRRFSLLGLVTVGTLLVTGTFNASQLVGDVPQLLGTSYGRILLVKLALVVPLLALAATNLMYIRPRMLATESSNCAFGGLLTQLRRNALLEAGIGATVVLVAATLGTTPPTDDVSLTRSNFPFFFGE